MSIKASIYHLTHYKYDRPVRLGPQIIRLKPAPHSRTKVISHSLKVTPSNHFVNLQQDPYGNFQARFVFPDPVTEFKIEVDLVADMTVYNPFDFFVEESATKWPFDYPETLKDDLSIYRKPEETGPLFDALMATIDKTPGQTTVDMIVASMPNFSRPSVTSSAWSPACRPRKNASVGQGLLPRYQLAFWCRCCAASGLPPASSPAISFSSRRI